MKADMIKTMTPCADCGMPCDPAEYHPFAACLMFKACHNSETVRANLLAVQGRSRAASEHGEVAAAEALGVARASVRAEFALHFPLRKPEVPAEQQGLFQKFVVRRTDGRDEPGCKHENCEYFVLDTNHDEHARAALAAYADAAEKSHPDLAIDMRQRYNLASMATSPASEAQAGAICRENYALVPVRKRPSCCDRGRDLSGGVSEECCGSGNCSQDEEEARARASWLAAPQPASSPVAAEGQKAVVIFDDPRVQMVYDFLCADLEPPADEHWEGWAARRIVTALATPTASMADAAEAVADDDAVRERARLLFDQMAVIADDGACLRLLAHALATPGPRGENAGGVVEALSEEVVREAGFAAAGVDFVADFESGARWAQRACATAWGLRIAEKGDARAIISAEPWLKSGEVRDRLEDGK